MSSETADDPPLFRRIAWGVMQAAIAIALLAAGGLQALQAVVIVAALPFALLLAAVLYSLRRLLLNDLEVIEEEEREFHRAEMRWLQRERESQADTKPDP